MTSIGWSGSRPSMAPAQESRMPGGVRTPLSRGCTVRTASDPESALCTAGATVPSATGESVDGTRTASQCERPRGLQIALLLFALLAPLPASAAGPSSSPTPSPVVPPAAQPDATPSPPTASASPDARPSTDPSGTPTSQPSNGPAPSPAAQPSATPAPSPSGAPPDASSPAPSLRRRPPCRRQRPRRDDGAHRRRRPDVGLHRHLRRRHEHRRALEHPRCRRCGRRRHDRAAAPGGHRRARRLARSSIRCVPAPASAASSATASAPPRPTRATAGTPTSGRCRRSAGTTSSAPSPVAAARSSPLLDTGVDGSHPTSPVSSCRAPASSTARDRHRRPQRPRHRHGRDHRRRDRQRRGHRGHRLRRRQGHARHRPRRERPRPGQRHHRRASSGPSTTAPTSSTCPSPTPATRRALQAAIDYAWAHNVVVVAATGNDGSSTVTFPAGDRGVIGVSNTDQTDALNPSSNYGADTFLGAPGDGHPDPRAGGGTATVSPARRPPRPRSPRPPRSCAPRSGASNGVIVGRLGRSAAAAGTRDQTGNGRLDLARAVADHGTAAVRPAGVVGRGGPFVGPYVAANKNLQISIAGGVGAGTVAFSNLVPVEGRRSMRHFVHRGLRQRPDRDADRDTQRRLRRSLVGRASSIAAGSRRARERRTHATSACRTAPSS